MSTAPFDRRLPLVAAWFLASGIVAQDQATTLAALATDSVHVAHARVVSRVEDQRVRVMFRTLDVIAGEPTDTFVLHEPLGAACGRALVGLAPGAGYLVFLGDDRRLVAPTPRAIVRPEPGLEIHVRALRAAGNDGQLRSRLLVQGLDSPSPRVRADAALALAICPGLENVSRETVIALRHHLGAALESDDLASGIPLLNAASRIGHPEILDDLLHHWIRGRSSRTAPFLRRAIRRFGPDVVANRVRVLAPRSQQLTIRADELLAEVARDGGDPIRPPRFRSIRPTGDTP
jgi:hypothetical protein